MTAYAKLIRARIAFRSGAERVEDGMHLSSDLAMDSLDRWALLADLEAYLGITITDREWLAVHTVSDVITLAEEKCR